MTRGAAVGLCAVFGLCLLTSCGYRSGDGAGTEDTASTRGNTRAVDSASSDSRSANETEHPSISVSEPARTIKETVGEYQIFAGPLNAKDSPCVQFLEDSNVVLSMPISSGDIPHLLRDQHGQAAVKIFPAGETLVALELKREPISKVLLFSLREKKKPEFVGQLEDTAEFIKVTDKPGLDSYVLKTCDVYPFGGASAVAPLVYLGVKNGKLLLDSERMRNEPLRSELHSRGSEIPGAKQESLSKNGFKRTFVSSIDLMKRSLDRPPLKVEILDQVPAEFDENVLRFVYAGRKNLSRKLVDQAWPANLGGKADYWSAIMAQYKKSRYYPLIEKL